jgi:hypothetical protein
VAAWIQVRYLRVKTGRGWQEPYDLDHPVVAIVGPVDTGKSSMLDCIAFAMGRDGDGFRGVVDHYLRVVEVGIRVRTGSYVLRRSRHSLSHVEVLDASGTSLGPFLVRGDPGGGPTISAWLLQQVGLDDSFSVVRLAGDKRLDFATSLLSYCYLTQDDIDRHIILPSRMEESRLVALRLMLKLTTPQFERLSGDIKMADNKIKGLQRRALVIRAFLEDAESTRSGTLQDRIAVLREQEVEAKAALADLEVEARAATSSFERERRLVDDARTENSDAEVKLDVIRRQHDRALAKVQDLRSQVDILQQITETSQRARTKPVQTAMNCPECGGSLQVELPQPGHCRMCKGPLPPHRIEAELARVECELEEAERAAGELRIRVQAADDRARASWATLKSVREEFDERSRESVAPYVDALADSKSRLARIEQELSSLNRVQDAHGRLRQKFDEVDQLQKDQEERRQRLDLSGSNVGRSEDVLTQMNAIFRKIIRVIELPNATGRARLDESTLLPVVDEQAFGKRGGGARSAVSIAYSLALLTYAREAADVDLPTLLMVDSPKKNFGSNADDSALAHRLYIRFLDYMTELTQSVAGARSDRPFQLIIVDNDIHRDIARRIKVVRFDRRQGFIQALDDLRAWSGKQLSIDDLDDPEYPQ